MKVKIKEKFKKTWLWLKTNVFTKQMIIPFLLAELIFWSPCIVTAILAICVSSWYWTAFSAVIAFWAGPFTPAVPLQIGLAFAIKKIGDKVKSWKKKKEQKRIQQ